MQPRHPDGDAKRRLITDAAGDGPRASSSLSALPDDVCGALLAFCEPAARHGLRATERRMYLQPLAAGASLTILLPLSERGLDETRDLCRRRAGLCPVLPFWGTGAARLVLFFTWSPLQDLTDGAIRLCQVLGEVLLGNDGDGAALATVRLDWQPGFALEADGTGSAGTLLRKVGALREWPGRDARLELRATDPDAA